jgi:hypothetical protein
MRQLKVNRIELIGQSEATNPQGLSHTLPLADCFSRTIIMPKEVLLTNHDTTTVDETELSRVQEHKWFAKQDHKNKKWYVARTVDCVYLHRFIMGAKKGEQVDHRDGNGLNNQKSNLRFCNHAQNQHNQQIKRFKKTSTYKGVHRPIKWNMWVATIQVNNTTKYIGHFQKEIDAARAYDIAALKYYGEFARLNFPKEAI